MNCRIKNFLILILSIGLTSFIICLFGKDQPVNIHFQTLVTETHKHFENFKENLKSTEDKKLEVEEKFLLKLGFKDSDSFNVNKNSVETEATKNGTPMQISIVTSVSKHQLFNVEDFIFNIQSILPSSPLYIWNIESNTPINEESDFSTSLKQVCNSTKCNVERFPFEDYPDHIKDLSLRAYRPLIIQTMLDRSVDGCILWLDIERRLLPLAVGTIGKFINLALTGGSEGIIAWSSGHHPTSSLTHPKMFPFFQTEVENYYFHRFVDPSQLLICNTQLVHQKVMLPWAKCCLIKECLAPFGSQSGGCRFDKKPAFRYSGCHAYDSSALNVVLGLAFPLHQPYVSRAMITRSAQIIPHSNDTTTTS